MTRKWEDVRRAKGGGPRYQVIAERDGRFWFLRVMGRPELYTQALRLDQAEAMVRDLIATWDDVDPASFDVVIRPHLEPDLERASLLLYRQRIELARAEEAVGDLTRALAAELVRGRGLTVRDAGRVLGLSHQRIAQLLPEPSGDDNVVDLAAVMERVARSLDEARAGLEERARRHEKSRPGEGSRVTTA